MKPQRDYESGSSQLSSYQVSKLKGDCDDRNDPP